MMSRQVVDHVHGLTPDRFARDYLRPRRPVKISGAIDDWPALSKWSFEFFRARGEGVRVETEVGDCLTKPTIRRPFTLAEYVAAIVDDRLVSEGESIPYLSVFPLLDHCPELSADIGPALWPNRHSFWIAWLGPAGTFSGLHYDRWHGLLAQIRGRKRVALYPRDQWRLMYESRKFDPGTVISEVDVRHVDEERWPLFRQATSVDVVLEPGDMLFIPRGSPHHVLALEPSISLTCFGRTALEAIVLEPRDRVLQTLHAVGVYRRGNCACHQADAGPVRAPRSRT